MTDKGINIQLSTSNSPVEIQNNTTRDVTKVTLKKKTVAGSRRLIFSFTDTESEECNISKI